MWYSKGRGEENSQAFLCYVEANVNLHLHLQTKDMKDYTCGLSSKNESSSSDKQKQKDNMTGIWTKRHPLPSDLKNQNQIF